MGAIVNRDGNDVTTAKVNDKSSSSWCENLLKILTQTQGWAMKLRSGTSGTQSMKSKGPPTKGGVTPGRGNGKGSGSNATGHRG